MGKPKKYDVMSINFGTFDHPARALKDIYIKEHGKRALSPLIRKLLVVFLSNDPEYKKLLAIYQFKESKKQFANCLSRRELCREVLLENNINPEEII